MDTPETTLPHLDRLTESGVSLFQQEVITLLRAESARLKDTEVTTRNHLLLELLFKGQSHDQP